MEKYKSTCTNKKHVDISEAIFNVNKQSEEQGESEVLGGIISDTKLSWLAVGPYLQVLFARTGEVRSVWCFGAITKEPNAKVVCVEEIKIPFKETYLLVVGLKYGNSGMICIYNLSCAKVLRAIEIPGEVTSVHVVNWSATFPGPLSALDGVVCVGTVGGPVYIIDLCKEQIDEARKFSNILDIRNELNPCCLKILSTKDVYDLERQKTAAEEEGTHCAILLNELETCERHFQLKTPQRKNLVLAAKEEVTVSTLHYAPQLCSLFVGYNFGALQMWSFITMRLEYTSPVYEEKIPVSFVSVQEPIDDPRAYCYFWVVYSCSGQFHNSFPLAALFALSYDSKDYHEGYGYIYQNLQNCAVRFQNTLLPVDVCNTPLEANCVRLQSYSKGVNNSSSTVSLTTPDDSYTVCMMAWNVRCEEHKVHTYLNLFDLNQWYKEQMPSLAHPDRSHNYMTSVCLSTGSYVSDACIDPATLSPYTGAQKLEEYYRPASLAYNILLLTECDMCLQTHLGVQRFFFRELEESGPLALMRPAKYYSTARNLGLAPLFAEMPAEPPHQQQFEALLSVALERKMLKWLCQCASSWEKGCHRQYGLTLDALLTWGWERTRQLKAHADRCCTCLFDYSGIKLDANIQALITSCRVQFGFLKDLFGYVVKNCGPFLPQADITRQQALWLQKNYAYFNVIGWMINLNLLPESRATYPIGKIADFYQEKRAQNSMLFIDSFVDKYRLGEEWREEGSGLYPPATLQNLLRSYFNVDLEVKSAHMLVAYTLLDLVVHAEEKNQNIATTMIKFPQIFDLSMSATKCIQAFWQLDHDQLEPAVNQLSRRASAQDIRRWQHEFIIQRLKHCGQYRLALMYFNSRNDRSSKDDVKTMIQLHVRNKMLFQALSIERRHADDALLEAFFEECLEASLLMDLTNFNFTKLEEVRLMEFMDRVNYRKKEEFKTVYFVRRGRFLDFYLHHDAESTNRHSMPTLVRNTLDAALPQVTKTVIKTCLALKNLNYTDTKPLSAYVCDKNERARFNNDFVKACVVNCKEKWSSAEKEYLTEDDFPFMRPPFRRSVHEPTHVLYPQRVDRIPRAQPHQQEEEIEAPPTKRMRLSATQDLLNLTSIETMHFERSNLSVSQYLNTTAVATPHSILKTLPSCRGESTTPEVLDRHLRRSLTPKLSTSVKVATPSVRFTGISSGSTTPSTPASLNPVITGGKQETSSTTTDYFSAETSPEDRNKRKRKFSDEVAKSREEPEVSVLRSASFQSIGNLDASKFLESMRHTNTSYTQRDSSNTEDTTIKNSFASEKSEVFVFTGSDAPVPHVLVTPKPRVSYQSAENRDPRANARKVPQVEQGQLQVQEETDAKIGTEIAICDNAGAEVTEKKFENVEVNTVTVIEKSVCADNDEAEEMEVEFDHNVTELELQARRSYQSSPSGSPSKSPNLQSTSTANTSTGEPTPRMQLKMANTIIEIDDSPFPRKVLRRSVIDRLLADSDPEERRDRKVHVTPPRRKYKTIKYVFKQNSDESTSSEEIAADHEQAVNDSDSEPVEIAGLCDAPVPHVRVTPKLRISHRSAENRDPRANASIVPQDEQGQLQVQDETEAKIDTEIAICENEGSQVTEQKLENVEDNSVKVTEKYVCDDNDEAEEMIVEFDHNVKEHHLEPQARRSYQSSPSGSPSKSPNLQSTSTSNTSTGEATSRMQLKMANTIIEIDDSPLPRKVLRRSVIDRLLADSDPEERRDLKVHVAPPRRKYKTICKYVFKQNSDESTSSEEIAADHEQAINDSYPAPVEIEGQEVQRTSVPEITIFEVPDSESLPEKPSGPKMCQTIIEIPDPPAIRRSVVERKAFLDLFNDTATSEADDHPEGGKELSEAPVGESSVNTGEDLSTPSASAAQYVTDPVMSNYNVNEDLLVPEAQDEDIEQEVDTLPSDTLRDDLFVETLYLNTGMAEIISIDSTSVSEDESELTSEGEETTQSSKYTESVNSGSELEVGEIAFIGESICVDTPSPGSSVSCKQESDVASKENSTSVDSLDVTIANKQDVISATKTPKITKTEVSNEEAASPPARRTRSSSISTPGEKEQTPSGRTTRKRVDSPALTIQLRPRRSSTEKPVVKAVARVRSISTDTPPSPPLAAVRKMRTRSVDAINEEKKATPKKRVGKAALPAIQEEKKKPVPAPRALRRKSEQSDEPTKAQKKLLEESTAKCFVRMKQLDKTVVTGAEGNPDEMIPQPAKRGRKKLIGSSTSLEVKTPRGRQSKSRTPERKVSTANESAGSGSEDGRNSRSDSGDSAPSRRRLRKNMSVIDEVEENETAAVDAEANTSKRGRQRKQK